MKNSWSNIEEKFLSKEEIEFIKHTIVRPDINKPETMKYMSWRGTIERNVLLGNATPEETKQYERIMEIECFVDIICEKFPKDIEGLLKYEEFDSKRKMELASKINVEEIWFDSEEAMERAKSERIMEEEFEQDIEEPFIQEMIEKYLADIKQSQKYYRLEKILNAAEFKAIDDKTFLSIAYLILEELKHAKKDNLKTSLDMKNLDKKKLIYLVIKNLKNIPLIIDEDTKNHGEEVRDDS